MWLKEIIWLEKFILKIQSKHSVNVEEVEDALLSDAVFCRARKGKVKGEDVYIQIPYESAHNFIKRHDDKRTEVLQW